MAKECDLNAEQIIDFDVCILDAQPASFFGLNNDFIAASRTDNLFSAFFALKAILSNEAAGEDSAFINTICLFDHEEIGSLSA